MLGHLQQEIRFQIKSQLSNVIDELKSLRKVVEENRKFILKEKELKAVKHELEETRSQCRGNPNSAEQKLEFGIQEVLSEDTINIMRIGEQSKINKSFNIRFSVKKMLIESAITIPVAHQLLSM